MQINWTNVYIQNDDKMIYKLESMREIGSQDNSIGLSVNWELVAGWDYVNPDENDLQGYVSAENYIDDVQGESFTFYPLHETLKEIIEDSGYTLIPTEEIKAIKRIYKLEG